ncbi:MAG: tetratricopeptide repeat protein [Desulfobacteraceae bacterium]|nr:tetratricopeptide repeat protein [Desulfobacteraceae bacterium]
MHFARRGFIAVAAAMLLAALSGCAASNPGGPEAAVGPYLPQLRPEIASPEAARRNLAELLSGANGRSPGVGHPAIPTTGSATHLADLLALARGAGSKAYLFNDESGRTMYAVFKSYAVDRDGITVNGKIFAPFDDLADAKLTVETTPPEAASVGSVTFPGGPQREVDTHPRPYVVSLPGGISFHFETMADAAAFADDLFAIQQAMKAGERVRAADFAQKAAQYRAAAVKPAVSEEQRRLIVQANALSERKDYAGAIDLYQSALDVDPVAYPGAYFNLALLSAQMERYPRAIAYMKQYLQLEPDAKDARSAQDKIYEWEILARKGKGGQP